MTRKIPALSASAGVGGWIVAVGGIAAWIGGTVLLTLRSAPAPSSHVAPAQRPAVEAPGIRGGLPPAVPAPVAVAAKPVQTAASVQNAVQPPELEKTEEEQEAERATELEATFTVDAAPTSGAVNRERGIAQAFRSAEVRDLAVLRDISCRMSRCRLEVTFARGGADFELVRKLFAGYDAAFPAGASVASRNKLSDGRMEATLFLRSPSAEGWKD